MDYISHQQTELSFYAGAVVINWRVGQTSTHELDWTVGNAALLVAISGYLDTTALLQKDY